MASSGQGEKTADFQAVKQRLEEIAKAVEDEDLPLDEALDLYEEAVKLGLEASNLLEVGIAADEESAEGEPAPDEGTSGVGAPAAEAQNGTSNEQD